MVVLPHPPQRRAQAFFDELLPSQGEDFLAVQFRDVEAVDGGSFFSRDFRQRNIHPELDHYLRDDVEQAKPVFRFNVDDGAVL